jgi:NADH:ubiquinone oxidoreductase subunit F (NADH-binding)/NADH:ubiquinone oxidoreductase subunit E
MAANRSIVQELHEIQKRVGYLPKEELQKIPERLRDVRLHDIYEVASFFPHFHLERPASLEVKVCRDMSCHLRGAAAFTKNVEALADELSGGDISVTGVSCLGQCDGAPALLIADQVYRALSLEKVRSLLRQATRSGGEFTVESLVRREPGPTGWKIDPYDGREEYGAVKRYVEERKADALKASTTLIGELKTANLLGMGGAGVPAHQKWKDVRDAPGETKYCVVNADESEPGTFKDRELLLRTPQLVIEGLILAGLVTGAERGYIYIRHEYEEAIEIVKAALAQAEGLGVCGGNVLGTGKAFPIEVFISPGGYICGEQSALIEAMEDHRAEPRNKPPELLTNGLRDKPTLVSNVETYAWVPSIYGHGGKWYADLGLNGAKGMRFFSISGDVNRPGVYELPSGVTLRTLIEDHARGLRGGQELKAFAPSGPSGGFLPATLPREKLPKEFAARLAERERAREALGFPEASATEFDILELELDLQTMRDLRLSLGPGVVVYGEHANMLDQALNASQFFRNESCGKCVPCRMGSQKLVQMATDLLQFQYDEVSIQPVEKLLVDLQRTMELTSICGLGVVAGSPLISIFRYFRKELDAYLGPPRFATQLDLASMQKTTTTTVIPGLPGPLVRRPIRDTRDQEDFEILGEPPP